MSNDEKITIPIDAATKRAIQHKAIDARMSVAEIARLLFSAWLRGEVEVEKPSGETWTLKIAENFSEETNG